MKSAKVSQHSKLEPKGPDVSVLIVGYNSAQVIQNCLNSILKACQNYELEVLFVDQGDGSTEVLVKEEFPAVTIVPSRGNLGFAGGNNLLKASAKGKNLLLLNPDVELHSNAIDILLDAAESYPEAAAWGGITLTRDGTPDIGNTVHVPSIGEMASRLFGRSRMGLSGHEKFDADERVAALSGGFVLISKTAWDEIEGLDERYFLYCEEVDFFYRLSQRGHSFWRISAARAFHDIGHGEAASPRRSLNSVTGKMQFARLHWSKPRQFLAFMLIWLGALERYLIGSLLGKFKPALGELARSNRLIALYPGHWRNGYAPDSGLLAKLLSRPID